MRARYDNKHENRLMTILNRGMPDLVVKSGAMTGKLNMTRLAHLLGISRQTLWNAVVKKNSISAECARKIIDLEYSNLTADDLLPYIR